MPDLFSAREDPVLAGRQEIGRNDPCPCGSGRKYKRCHLSADRIAKEGLPRPVVEYFQRTEAERRAREEIGLYVDFVNPILHQGHKMWAIGGGLYDVPNPSSTFHDLILNVLGQTLGKEWWQEESAKEEDEQHFVARCFSAHSQALENRAEAATEVKPGVWAMDPDGLSQYLHSLAFDVACLIHRSSLPEDLLKRLRHRDQFQGARYEIAVAAILARIDCKIIFYGDDYASRTHPEFVAVFGPTGEEVAVEVKSRHRPGVLHHPGERDSEKALRGDVRRQLREALKQDPQDMAFCIFIDVNSPPTPEIDLWDKGWLLDIKNLLADYKTATPEDPDPFAMLCFTNFAWHYEEGILCSGAEHVVARSPFTRDSLSDELVGRLQRALSHYGQVPLIDIDEGPDTGATKR